MPSSVQALLKQETTVILGKEFLAKAISFYIIIGVVKIENLKVVSNEHTCLNRFRAFSRLQSYKSFQGGSLSSQFQIKPASQSQNCHVKEAVFGHSSLYACLSSEFLVKLQHLEIEIYRNLKKVSSLSFHQK